MLSVKRWNLTGLCAGVRACVYAYVHLRSRVLERMSCSRSRVHVCVCVCVCACVRACVRACVCVCVLKTEYLNIYLDTPVI